MSPFWKKEPSKPELDRIDKKKAASDRERMEDFRARLDAASAFIPDRFSEEDKAQMLRYFKSTSECAKNVAAVSFDVTGIDRGINGVLQVLERALKEGGSAETIMRCFQGLSFGLLKAHSQIPENSDPLDMTHRREDVISRYYQIVSQNLEIDMAKKDIKKQEEAKKEYEMLQEETEKTIGDIIKEHPTYYYQLKDMTPTELDSVTGETKALAALMRRAVNLEKNINQIDLTIGQRNQDIYTLENSCNSLFLQLTNWESELDEKSIAEILRLGDAFQKQLLEQTQMMKKINEASDNIDKAIQYLLAGANEKEAEIQAFEAYERLKNKQQLMEKLDKEGQIRYEQEQAAKEEQLQKQAEEQMRQSEENKEMYYN